MELLRYYRLCHIYKSNVKKVIKKGNQERLLDPRDELRDVCQAMRTSGRFRLISLAIHEIGVLQLKNSLPR